jgi:DNA-binding SARP family transcriptional activator
MVEFDLLGALGAHVDGRPVDLGHPVQQRVLAALLVDANRVVPVDRLVDRVWDEHPPVRARHTLYSYLSRLRRAGAGIDRCTGGYTLTVDPDAVDLHRFRRLVERARHAPDAHALGLVERALRLWRGEPFAGLDSPWLGRLRDRLCQEHLAARLLRNDLALRGDGHDELLPELLADSSAHPFDEHLAGQVMLALHRCGRSAEALRHYHLLRTRMVDELGVDPGPRLRELHRHVLSADDHHYAAPAPRQLPAPPAAFVGRERERAALDAALAEDPGRSAVAVVLGAGGVGKTWLALRWAHDNQVRFPDGQLYVDLRGFDPTGRPLHESEALHAFLEALDVTPERIPAGVDARAALYRSLLADRRVLVVLDNAVDPDQVRSLLPGSPTCRVLVTSRNRMAGLVLRACAVPVALGVPSDREAEALLAARLGARRTGAEPDAVRALVLGTACLPLALGIVAARALANPELSLRALAEELRDEHRRLDALTAGDPAADVRAVTSWSYRALTADAARLFRLLGRHRGPDLDARVAAALLGAGLGVTRELLAELVTMNLLDEHVPGRYHLHDLLRVYAAERAAEEEPAPARPVERDHYWYEALPGRALDHDSRRRVPSPR